MVLLLRRNQQGLWKELTEPPEPRARGLDECLPLRIVIRLALSELLDSVDTVSTTSGWG